MRFNYSKISIIVGSLNYWKILIQPLSVTFLVYKKVANRTKHFQLRGGTEALHL